MRKLLTLPTLLAGDLPDNTADDGSQFLYCPKCHSRYSADRSDYFWLHDTSPLTCEHCKTSLRLVREKRKLEVLA